jgi:SAM-dependent methyltransferase
VSADSVDHGTSARRSALLERWRSVLTAGAAGDPADAIVAELAEYYGIDPAEARQRCDDYVRHSAEDWDSSRRETPAELIEYWSRWGPMFGVLMSHAHQYTGKHPASSVDIAEAIADRPVGDMLDYGVGPGSSALFFQQMGWRVVAADVADAMLDITRWRAERRGVDLPVLDLRTQPVPRESFDVVVALEVMAHVPDIPETLATIRQSLRPGGLFIFNVYAPPAGPDTKGHLFVGNWHVIRHVRSAGFAKRGRVGKYYRYERVDRSPLRRAGVRAVDFMRHSQPVHSAAQLARRVLQSRR